MDFCQPYLKVATWVNYWMARYPVTNELYNEYIDAEGLQHPVDDWEEKKDHPVVNIKWTDAVSYCQWINNLLKAELPTGLMLRLPTEAEWEKAACGTDGREYPWGNTFDNKRCNTREAQKGSTTPVGLYSQQGDSPYGCADMAGNVWEWTRSLIKEYPYKFNDGREDNHFSSVRVLRGGSYSYYEGGARCAARSDYPIDAFISSLGFRVAIS
jgi:formylglycine-generating enzyme required for sulfatase activity